MAVQIQLRHDTSTNWTAANPLLMIGEMGLETDTQKQKIGDGVTLWNSLPYSYAPGVVSVGMTAPSLMTVSGSPITGTGTLGLSWSGAGSNLVNADGSTTVLSTLATVSSLSSYLTTATAASTYAPIASPTFTGTVTLPVGLSGVLKATAGVTGVAVAGTDYISPAGLTTTLASYLTTATAASTYAPVAGDTSLVTVGTITTGTWHGSVVGTSYGGTGLSSLGTLGTAILPYTSASSGFLKWSGSAFSIDTSTYLTANQSITLSGDVSGTGTTAISVAVNKMLGNTIPANAAGFLQNNGTGTLSWGTAGVGTVTSIGLTVPANLSVTPASITSSGTFAVTWSGSAANFINADGSTTAHALYATIASPTFTGTVTTPAFTLSGFTTGILKNTSGVVGTATAGTDYFGVPAGTTSQILSGTGSVLSTLPTSAFPALTGAITTTAGALATTLSAGAVALSNMATLAAHSVIGNLTGSSATPVAVPANAVAAANTIPVLDGNVNLAVNTIAPTTQSIATASGTTTLTVTSPYQTIFTGTLAQTLVLPAANTGLVVGTRYEIDNNSTGLVTIQTNGGATLWILASNTCILLTLTGIGTAAGTWDDDYLSTNTSTGKVLNQADNLSFPVNTIGNLQNDGAGNITYGLSPDVFNALDIYGHSYFDMAYLIGQGTSTLYANNNAHIVSQLCGATGLDRLRVKNHACIGSTLLGDGRSAGSFARALSEIKRDRQTFPFTRSGATTILCWGINDVGNIASGSQTLMRTNFGQAITAVISRARASAIFLAGAGGQWAHGTNFSVVTTTVQDYTSGNAISAAAVDSSGTSTATFTIPLGYQGEPICFTLVGTSGSSGIVTWGGTVTGTSGILTTTTTLSSTMVGTFGIIPVRYTAAANGLSAANAGQTITIKVTTYTAGAIVIDGCHIEALNPDPVLVCNVPRLCCKSLTVALGDGVTTGVNTSFTSASAAFLSSTDAGVAITETDAQGAFTAGKTVSSVTNATTIVLSGNATGAFSNIKYTLARIRNGYATNSYTNTDFSGATVASHATADSDVTSLNSAIATAVGTFDSMVQIVDLDTPLGTDPAPTGILSYFAYDGLHFNEYGIQQFVKAILLAASKIQPATTTVAPLGIVEACAFPAVIPAPRRAVVSNAGYYLPEGASLQSTSYTAVAGDMFAYPMYITDPTVSLGAFIAEQTNAPATAGSNIRVGYYDDVNFTGYPQCLRNEMTSGATFAMGTTSGVKTLATAGTTWYAGHLLWVVFKIDSLGTTASQIRNIIGPNPYLPSWLVAGGQLTPICWKLTGQAAGVFPTIFPTGGVLTSSAPAIGVQYNLQ